MVFTVFGQCLDMDLSISGLKAHEPSVAQITGVKSLLGFSFEAVRIVDSKSLITKLGHEIKIE